MDKKKLIAGSFTVEATFIMPIILMTIFSLIYLSFYLHDVCRLQAIVDKTLNKAGLIIKHEASIEDGETDYENINGRGVFYLVVGNTEDEEESIQAYLQQELGSGLFLAKVMDINVNAEKFKVSISVKADMQISLVGVRKLLRPFAGEVVVEGKSIVHNPAEFIRMAEVIMDTGVKIKGVEELKEKLANTISKVR